jgi:diacylglycerol kinase family enzyme/membrane-associated phospholipid phosphatase
VKRVLRLVDPVNEVDRGISRRVAGLPPTRLDTVMKGLTTSANHSLLWFGVAGILALRRGASRKAGARGVLAIAMASGTANALCKPLLPRRRPAAAELPAYQTLPSPPTSSSFPSGHAASAAAFATAVGLESPKLGLAIAPVAAAVGYSRVHVGVHWASDVAAGAALGAGVALLTRRWWPVRRTDEARARPVDSAPVLPDGEGLLMLVNQFSGDPNYDPVGDVARVLPRAEILTVQQGRGIQTQLEAALARRGTEVGTHIKALGVTGGDGSVGAGAAVAERHGLPLVVVPLGTLNHFARDVGVYDLQEVDDATRAGQAVAVDLGIVEVHPDAGSDDEVVRVRTFLNTASIGSYPELVRLREHWQPRWGKWPAFVAALMVVLHRAQPVRVHLLGEWRTVWFLFVGNGPYYPRGMVPAWRPTLDSGLLDVRWLRADARFSRLRVMAALLLGALGHSRVYAQREVPELDVELEVPGMLATDGEVVEYSGRYTFRVAAGRVLVYRRDEQRWTGRSRPFVG